MTIPSTPSQILVTEDWKKIYQSYPNAEFQSYDFDTLRRIMIQYLQENFPEDFNDYVDSSEYIALVDLIAYLGQNLSFRIDLNARENFLETASRRDSILRLAQLISYVPARNTPASGVLKITAISTTDNVFDSTGVNLSNTTVIWNDATNSNWYEQFIDIINAAMNSNFKFGSPLDTQTINGILTEQYNFNSSNVDIPVFDFLKTISGTPMNFEIVPVNISSGAIVEQTPEPGASFSFIYQNDYQGNSSANTGFFTYFKQGQLGVSNFNVNSPAANELIGVNINSINNNDVWLWQLDNNGNYSTLWTQVPAITGSSVIYNSLNSDVRNIYSVTTRDNDQIDLNFADGVFGNLPQGNFSLFYRQSNGLTYTITPQQMSGITIDIPYTNQNGQSQILTLTMGLQYTVDNSAGPESNSDIQLKAPQAFYTQNRMVTAEDYQISPLTLGSNILKVKSLARVTSGVSRYFELSDVSGKYSSTNIFGSDGILYKDDSELNFTFTFANQNDIWNFIKTQVEPIVTNPSTQSFYFDQYRANAPILLSSLGLTWTSYSVVTGQSTGYFQNSTGPVTVGTYISNNLKYVYPGSLIKFQNPTGNSYTWATVIQVTGNGSQVANNVGPIVLSNKVANGAVPVEIIPAFINSFTYAFETNLVSLCQSQQNFGLSFDQTSRSWTIISDNNLNLNNTFSLQYQGDSSGLSLDSSWIIAFVWNGDSYEVRYRFTKYVFQSNQETAFYIDPNNVNYDFVNNTVVKDQIKVLSINPQPNNLGVGLGKDFQWQIDGNIVETDGYVDPSKVEVSFYNYNNLGQISDPDAFTATVATNLVFFQLQSDGQTYQLVDDSMFEIYSTPDAVTSPVNGQLYYFSSSTYNVVNLYSSTSTPIWIYQSGYAVYPGTSNLKFQYIHNSGEDTRIDPSKTNIIDIYLLTADYDAAYRAWLSSGTGSEPLPPTSNSLSLNYSSLLEPIKTISDQIIFQPVSYKVLFGSQADPSLQATFKAVQSPTSVLSASNLQSSILTAINNFFALSNWDFGQSFYFSELSAYVMNLLTPNITNFVIVPNSENAFGSLYEVTCLDTEIFVSGATINDIEIISAITASQLNLTTNIVTSAGN